MKAITKYALLPNIDCEQSDGKSINNGNNNILSSSLTRALNKKLCCFFIILLAFLILLILVGRNSEREYQFLTIRSRWHDDNNDEDQQQPIPLILGWNNFHYFGNVMDAMTGLSNVKECPLQCIYSSDRAMYANASAIIFYIRVEYGQLPAQRLPHQLYAFYLDEPPHYTFDFYKKLPPDFFNITISYRTDSDVFFPYDRFVPHNNESHPDEIWTDEEILQKLSKKTKLALQVNSDCNTPSKREELVDELRHLVNVTLLGKCLNGDSCDYESCYNREIESHFFYLAFENAVCRDYVTEKFWNLKHLIVSVVLTRRGFSELGIPADSFVAADDFRTVQELADHLLMLQQNQSAYLNYFRWTKHYRKTHYHAMRRLLSQKYHQTAIRAKNATPAPDYNPLCQLCELVHRQQKLGHPRRVVSDIWRWWQAPDVCIDNFVPLWKQGNIDEAFSKANWPVVEPSD